jgi:hypothetical protein
MKKNIFKKKNKINRKSRKSTPSRADQRLTSAEKGFKEN